MKPEEAMIAFSREALNLPPSTLITLSPLGKRGSDRAYFRVEWDRGSTAILVHYDPKRAENAYYADIAAFLASIGIPVPRIVRHDPAACLAVIEDLGDTDLWSFRQAAQETRLALYRKTLSAIHRLHSFPAASLPRRVRLMESFGPDLYRWERDYFRAHFVGGFCGIEPEPRMNRELETELSALADRLAGGRVCLIHRDLQSRNVMVRDGEPFFIDFQGMRKGSASYDLGSLLCDPYVSLSDAERDELLSFYYGLSAQDVDRVGFENAFWEASAQRLMQALGAYGFLGLKLGLDDFLAHIPAGLDNLVRATGRIRSLPRLRELAEMCRDSYPPKP
jgi:aminoglycoside/choline kinase family phosphotransferase